MMHLKLIDIEVIMAAVLKAQYKLKITLRS